jgi:hypothetical protein
MNTNCSDHDCNSCAGSSSLQSIFGVHDIDNLIHMHDRVAESKIPNAFGCKIPIYSKLNVTFLRKMLSNYHDSEVVKFLEFGFPINCQGNSSGLASERNHTGANNFPDKMEKYLKKECTYGAIIGPFSRIHSKLIWLLAHLILCLRKKAKIAG